MRSRAEAARCGGLLFVALILLAAIPSRALCVDLVSASFRLRGLHPSSIGPARLASTAPTPAIGESGVSLGQGDAIGPEGSSVDLASVYPGFWPLVAGGLPSLDADGDDRPAFLDPDDDNDGLEDPVETDTGVFVSTSDTGTSPVDPDSDGDGFADGVEVAAGSDPTDSESTPSEVAVPAMSGQAYGALALLVVFATTHLLRRRSHAK